MNLSDDCDLLYISCQFAGRTRSFAALSHEAEYSSGTLCGHLALTLSAKWLPTDEFSVSAVIGRLCVSQAAADDPHIRYHHRGNAEYNQVFHCVISLFDW
jgi:hypothetical protein